MTTRKDDCKKTMTARKRWLQRTASAKSSFGKKSRTNALFSQLQLAVFDGSLARERHIQNFNLQFLTESLHEGFVCTTSTCRFWRKSRTKASFAQRHFAGFEGNPAWKLRFYIFSWQLDHGEKMWRSTDPSLGTNPYVFILPNSKLYFLPITYSITYSHYLIPITSVFTVKGGLLIPYVQKQKKDLYISSLTNARAPFTWENTGNRN